MKINKEMEKELMEVLEELGMKEKFDKKKVEMVGELMDKAEKEGLNFLKFEIRINPSGLTILGATSELYKDMNRDMEFGEEVDVLIQEVADKLEEIGEIVNEKLNLYYSGMEG